MDQKQNKEVIFIIASVVVIIAVAYFFISPAISSLKKTNYDLKIKQTDLARAQENLDNVKSLQSSLSSKANDVRSIIAALPTYEDTEDLLVTIEAVANKNGISVSAVAPQSLSSVETETAVTEESSTVSSEEGGYSVQELSVDLTLKGSYENLKSFLSDLESNRRPINVTKISIAGGGADPTSSVVNLSFITYYLSKT
jgi:Tfp pilus assembly protein PilO